MWLGLVLCLSACLPHPTATTRPASSAAFNPVPTASSTQASSGCYAAPPVAPPERVRVGGLDRSIITAVPASYRSETPHALVLAFHGRTNSNAQAREYFFLENAIRNTLFVYPSGLRNGNSFTWSNSNDSPDTLRDYALFDEIVRVMAATYCLDTNRIFVTGHSLGAWFANSLACARGDVIRAVATLAGGISASSCPGGAAAMILHNPEDNLVPVAQGEAARQHFLKSNRASQQSVPMPSEPLKSFRCQWHSDRGNVNPVVWCPHNFSQRWDGSYYPHTWPESTGRAIAYFFSVLR